ncbi:MAG: hypothetical protein HY841_01650 [Bacteroidetes bacterium]|nr:hypothetical protein [Bacteroidota bacterium]
MLRKVDKPDQFDEFMEAIMLLGKASVENSKYYETKRKTLYTELEKLKTPEEKIKFLENEKIKNHDDLIEKKKKYYNNENVNMVSIEHLYKRFDKEISGEIAKYEPLIKTKQKNTMNPLSNDEIISSGLLNKAIENHKFYLDEKQKRFQELKKRKTYYEKCEYLMTNKANLIELAQEHQNEILKTSTADERAYDIDVMAGVLERLKYENESLLQEYKPFLALEIENNKQKEKKENSENEKNKNADELDLTEQILLISYLQDEGLFVKRKPQQTEKNIQDLIALLLNQNYETIKSKFQDIKTIKEGRITSAQARHKIKNLKNISEIFKTISADNTYKKINERITELEKIANS